MTKRNEPLRLAGSGTACLLLLIAFSGTLVFHGSAAAGNQQRKHAGGNEDWVQPTFHGLLVGKSTTGDVIRTFGKPKWKGGVQELVVPSDKGGEIQYEYSAVPGMDGDMKIYFGKRSGVVTAI